MFNTGARGVGKIFLTCAYRACDLPCGAVNTLRLGRGQIIRICGFFCVPLGGGGLLGILGSVAFVAFGKGSCVGHAVCQRIRGVDKLVLLGRTAYRGTAFKGIGETIARIGGECLTRFLLIGYRDIAHDRCILRMGVRDGPTVQIFAVGVLHGNGPCDQAGIRVVSAALFDALFKFHRRIVSVVFIDLNAVVQLRITLRRSDIIGHIIGQHIRFLFDERRQIGIRKAGVSDSGRVRQSGLVLVGVYLFQGKGIFYIDAVYAGAAERILDVDWLIPSGRRNGNGVMDKLFTGGVYLTFLFDLQTRRVFHGNDGI